jgi:hypothetical protein
MCADAKKAREHGAKGKSVDRSRFCPHPESDPTHICQVNSWYFADAHQHEQTMSGLNSFETFWDNESHFTLEEFMKEVYANYEECGNNCERKGFRGIANVTYSGDLTPVRGFTLPVCQNDYGQNKLSDFSKKGTRRHHFPAVCGDWKSNETEDFMLAMNLGPDSPTAKLTTLSQLWRDRIPRVSLPRTSPRRPLLTESL